MQILQKAHISQRNQVGERKDLIMAEQASHEKKSKPGFFKRITRSFKDMKGEIKKVVWPSKSSIINNTVVVIVVCLVFGVFIWGLDGVLSWLVQVVLKNA